jgi:hypothetical protein
MSTTPLHINPRAMQACISVFAHLTEQDPKWNPVFRVLSALSFAWAVVFLGLCITVAVRSRIGEYVVVWLWVGLRVVCAWARVLKAGKAACPCFDWDRMPSRRRFTRMSASAMGKFGGERLPACAQADHLMYCDCACLRVHWNGRLGNFVHGGGGEWYW